MRVNKLKYHSNLTDDRSKTDLTPIQLVKIKVKIKIKIK